MRTLAAGPEHGLAVAEDGTVWTWVTQNGVISGPARVSGLTGVVAVAAGVSDNVALRGDGTVWVWPAGTYTPQQVTALNGSLAIAAGTSVLALKRDGTVWESSNRSVPRQVPGLAGVTALAAGFDHYVAVESDGSVWEWGYRDCHRFEPIPVRVAGLSNVVAVAAGGVQYFWGDYGWIENYSLALTSDGTVWDWGCNDWTVAPPGVWPLSWLSHVVAIAAGVDYGLALREDGTVSTWGVPGPGASGIENMDPVPGLSGVVAIAAGNPDTLAGNAHTLAAKSDGSLWAWRPMYKGQLGGGSAGENRSTPAQVSGLPALLPDQLVLNAASLRPGAVAPGEIVSIYGIGLGSSDARMAKPNHAGMFEKALGETTVLFDGVPAPVLFARTDQVNVAVPYAVAGKATTTVQTAYRGARSIAQTLTVADSAPGIFTADASGSGQGAILNDDLEWNSALNPALRGSTVTLFATGEGQTTPAGVDGQVSAGPLPRPILPVTVEIGGQKATVVDWAAAPGSIAGVLRVQVRVPETLAPGPAVPITLIVGTARSPDGVTVAIAP